MFRPGTPAAAWADVGTAVAAGFATRRPQNDRQVRQLRTRRRRAADALADLSDPRLEPKRLHRLGDVLAIAMCTVVAGAEMWEQIAEYGRRKHDFFRRYLALPHGVPSHDTFCRLSCRLDEQAFAAGFGKPTAAACRCSGMLHVAVDGKSVRRSRKATATGCLHLVSAWAGENRLILGQQSVKNSHEIAVVPGLLKRIDLKGALVTVDAAGCREEIARQVVAAGGNDLPAVNGNQPTLHGAVIDAFAAEDAGGGQDCDPPREP